MLGAVLQGFSGKIRRNGRHSDLEDSELNMVTRIDVELSSKFS